MKLLDIVRRSCEPAPWAEGEKIPWHQPDFSVRMLGEHLSQDHDAASRRSEIIDRHVTWIHEQVLQGKPTRLLDLACCPGLYAIRLARLGHHCVGIDFSPASIAYAREQASREGLDATYIQDDIRRADYGNDYALVMLIYGELNVFRPQDAAAILKKAYSALLPDGVLFLEPHTFDAVRKIGDPSRSWHSAKKGLFSDKPYLCLQENFWDAVRNVATERYYVIDAATGVAVRHAASTQAYTNDEYGSLLSDSGFGEVTIGLPAEWDTGEAGSNLTLVLAQKRPPD